MALALVGALVGAGAAVSTPPTPPAPPAALAPLAPPPTCTVEL